MILDISTLYSQAGREEIKQAYLDMEVFASKMGVFPVLNKEPFELHLSNVENKRLLIRGELDVTFAVPCDRCLSEVPTKLHLVIEKDLPIEEPASGLPESSTSGQEEDSGIQGRPDYIDGYRLDVDRLVCAELFLIWPMKVLCRDDCKGICSKCGANLNETSCGCDRTVVDPRMAAFQDVFDKFKEV